MTEQTAIWQPWHEAGLEHLRLVEGEDGAFADSFVIQMSDGQPFRVHYEIHIDAAWRVRTATIDLWAPEPSQLTLHSDGAGRWTDASGTVLDDLNDCIDIDITATPFTNTLPIKRLQLEPGESAEIAVAYIRLPELSVESAQQRYTCLEKGSDGSLYRYEGVDTGFVTNLPVDLADLVIDYPGIYRRLPLE